ncbi:phage antirepressor KilAC domain-containing protein [Streptomyces sp. NPDC057438]|uniref:phage antirepressor KilAC domain-containing protein n=1 Tax=Streptomyces sp. NPDC057438 TaxID=3346133 RepID=UPI00367ABE4D
MERHPTNELILTESRTMRTETIERTHVLDKVKTLVTLPDSFHVTTEMVASYYEVPLKTIESVVEDNAAELEENGRRVLRGYELTSFAAPFGGVANLGLSPKARSLAVFSRKAVLNIGQLLTKSEVARKVRTYLLESEEASGPRVPRSFAEALELAASQARMLEQAVTELEVAAPKAEAHDRLIAHGQDRLVRDTAKELGIPEGVLREKLLTEWRWIYRSSTECGANQYNPYASKIGYFSLREREAPHYSRENCWHATLYVTPAGREAMRRKLAQESLEPAAADPTPALVLDDTTVIDFRRGA